MIEFRVVYMFTTLMNRNKPLRSQAACSLSASQMHTLAFPSRRCLTTGANVFTWSRYLCHVPLLGCIRQHILSEQNRRLTKSSLLFNNSASNKLPTLETVLGKWLSNWQPQFMRVFCRIPVTLAHSSDHGLSPSAL